MINEYKYTSCSENCGNMVKNNEENTIPICSSCETRMIKGWGGYIKVNMWGMPIKYLNRGK